MLNTLIALDKKIFLLIQEYIHTRLFDFLMPIITNFDYWKIPAVLFLSSLAIWGGKKGRMVALLTLVVFILSDQLSVNILKPIFSRARPYLAFPQISPLIESAPKYSFPSTHASNIFAVTVLLSYYYRKFLPLNLFIAFMVSFARVYEGVHYPSDAVAGAILGVACAFLVIGIERLITKKISTIQPSPVVNTDKVGSNQNKTS
jgi:undecaprenyl-diphosphatase